MSAKKNASTQRTGMWRWWVVGGAGVALATGLSVYSGVGGHKASVETRNAIAVADGGAGPASAQLAAMRFPVGVEYTFELRESTRVATASGQPLAQFDLQGPLTLAAIDASATTRVRGEFHGVLRTVAGVDAGDPAATMADAAQRPFLLEFAPDGGFVGARAEPGTPAFVTRIWSALGEYLQFVRAGAGDRWEARETDASGEYVATYEVRAAGRVAKRKVRYTKLTASTLQGYSVLRSDVGFDFDDRSALETFDLEEATRTEMGSGAPLPPFEGATTLTLRRTGARVCTDEIAGWLAQARHWSDVTHKHLDKQDQATLDHARIQGLTVREALARLQPVSSRSDAGADARDRAGRAFVALAALLRQDPSALAQVRELLLKKGPLTDTLLAALRDASTPEAQKLLAQMTSASSPLDTYDRMEATRDLSLVGSPTSDTVQALKDLRNDADLGTQATYGLGSALHKLQDEDPGLAADTRNALTSQLSSSTTDGQRAAVLTAFGNAGDPTTLDLIRKFVSDPSPSVRAAAAQALRRIPGPDADALLAGLCADPVPAVRESALDAVRERPASDVLVSAVTPVALGDQDYRARALAVNTLAQWLTSDSAIAPTLQQVAASDPSEDLRNVARHALGRG